MLNKKRGLIVLVLIFLVLPFQSFSQIELVDIDSLEQEVGLALSMDSDSCNYDTREASSYEDGTWDPGGSCDEDDFVTATGYDGCDVLIRQQDCWPDCCGQYYIESGYILFPKAYPNAPYMTQIGSNMAENDGYVACFDEVKWYSSSDDAGICVYSPENDRHYWYPCREKNVGDFFLFHLDSDTTGIYACLTSEEGNIWLKIGGQIEKDLDLDKDGVPNAVDCAPYNEKVHGSFCIPKFDESGDEIKDAEGEPEMECLAATTEICGDGIDNDCSDWDGISSGYDYENSGDDCDKPEYGFACAGETNSEELDLSDDEENAEVQNQNTIEGHCLKEEKSCAWKDFAEGNGCCGDDGLEDIGMKIEDALGNFVCMNSEYVKTAGGFDDCSGDWCWVDASPQDVRNKIYTVSVPGETPYDYVSTGENWFQCKDEDSETSPTFSLAEDAYILSANRFYCNKEGEHYAWADCIDSGKEVGTEETAVQKNEMKERKAGDGLFAINLEEANSDQLNTLDIKIDKIYSTFYGDSPISISEMDFMHVFFSFDKITDKPLDLNLKIQGGNNVGGSYLTYMDKSILGYAENNPILEENRVIHLKVPLFEQKFVNVKLIKLQTNGQNEINVRNIYFSNDANPMVCSGEDSNHGGESAWLTNYDAVGERITGENICNALFDPNSDCNEYGECIGKAWLGDDLPEESRCCGDDPNEYYAGDANIEE